MGVAIFAGRWDIGPGNVPAIPRVVVREVRDLGKTGRGQGMVKVGMVRVLGTKVHVLIVGRWGTRLQSAKTHEPLRRCRSLRLQVPKVR